MTKNWQQGQVREPHQFHPTIQTVPLEGSEWREARLNVPKQWALAEPHTNDFLMGQKYLESHIANYVEWLSEKGFDIIPGTWERVSMTDVPMGRDVGIEADYGSEQSRDEMMLFIWVFQAKLNKPMFIKLEDRLAIEDDAKTFGVDLENEDMPWNKMSEITKDHIEVEHGDKPLELAEARRQKMGLKREDFIIGDLRDPA